MATRRNDLGVAGGLGAARIVVFNRHEVDDIGRYCRRHYGFWWRRKERRACGVEGGWAVGRGIALHPCYCIGIFISIGKQTE